MALQQRTLLGKTTINHQTGGHLESQLVTQVYDDVTNEIISSDFHRGVVEPDDDANAGASGSGHIAAAAWTLPMRDKHQKRLVLKSAEDELTVANNAVADAITQGLPTAALEAIADQKSTARNAASINNDAAEQAYIASITIA